MYMCIVHGSIKYFYMSQDKGEEFVQVLSFFSNHFHYHILVNCMQHDYCDEINTKCTFKLRQYMYIYNAYKCI